MWPYRGIRWAKTGESKMRKTTIVIAALLAACFTVTGADAAKKRMVRAAKSTVAADPIAEWNKKNMPAMQPAPMWVDPTAAKPARKAMRHHRMAKKAMKPMKRAAKKK